MDIYHIQQIIDQAKQHEYESRGLAKYFSLNINRLHRFIQFPDQGGEAHLVDFVVAYVEQVPELLRAVSESAQHSGIAEHVDPFLDLATEFFLHPQESGFENHEGLQAIMDEAYLSLRLLEEVNDRCMARTGFPLIPVDVSEANLIVHQLIGEPFVNHLDDVVHHLALEMIAKEHVYDCNDLQTHLSKKNKSEADWLNEAKHWPCLTSQTQVHLSFSI